MNIICNICKNNLENPYLTPCNHKFCFICISRHLIEHIFCPTCFYKTIIISQLKSIENYSNHLKLIKQPFFENITISKLKLQCKKFYLRTDGNKIILIKRLKEFYLLYNNEVNKKKPKTINNIAALVHNKEQLNSKKIVFNKKEIKKAFRKLVIEIINMKKK